jgi:hypothetical protein
MIIDPASRPDGPILFIYHFVLKQRASLIAKPELHMAANWRLLVLKIHPEENSRFHKPTFIFKLNVN